MKKWSKRGDETPGLAFVAFLLIGLGVGQYFGRPDAGVLVGLGLGFLAMLIVKIKYPKLK